MKKAKRKDTNGRLLIGQSMRQSESDYWSLAVRICLVRIKCKVSLIRLTDLISCREKGMQTKLVSDVPPLKEESTRQTRRNGHDTKTLASYLFSLALLRGNWGNWINRGKGWSGRRGRVSECHVLFLRQILRNEATWTEDEGYVFHFPCPLSSFNEAERQVSWREQTTWWCFSLRAK